MKVTLAVNGKTADVEVDDPNRFHGHEGFRGQVDHHFDPNRGYRGALPQRGERPHPSNSPDRMAHFSGTEMRDGRGHASEMGGHEGGHEGGGGHR